MDLRGKLSKARISAVAVCAFASASASSGYIAATPEASASAIYYCGFYVFGKTDCFAEWDDPYGRGVGYFTTNHAYIPNGAGRGFVCEHTYIYGGGTISRRCGGNFVTTGSCTGSDLWPYASYILDARAGNSQDLTEPVDGHAWFETCV